MRLVTYFIIVLISSVVVAAAGTVLINKGLQRSGVDFYGKMNAARNTIPAPQLLIVGSSRALSHLDTRIFDSVTRLHSYNYGLNAASIHTCYNIIKYALAFQKNVKAVILNIDYNMFSMDNDPYKAAYYYPFDNFTPLVNTKKEQQHSFFHQLRVFDVSLYDDYAKYAAVDGWLRPNREVAGLYNGYYPHPVVGDFQSPPAETLDERNAEFSENGIAVLGETIRLAKMNNIKLFLVVAPYYTKYKPSNYIKNYHSILNRVRQTAEKTGASFLDFTSLPLASDPANFYNVNHLNVKGATVYSLAVADSINGNLHK